MKIGKYTVVGGPNLNFYACLLLFTVISIANKTWFPIGLFVLICVVSIPLSFWAMKWDLKQGKKMLEDFPYDREIQRKYARYKE